MLNMALSISCSATVRLKFPSDVQRPMRYISFRWYARKEAFIEIMLGDCEDNDLVQSWSRYTTKRLHLDSLFKDKRLAKVFEEEDENVLTALLHHANNFIDLVSYTRERVQPMSKNQLHHYRMDHPTKEFIE